MDRYEERMTIRGKTQRERHVNRLKKSLLVNAPSNPSCKDILLNGEPTQLIINTGTKSHYKEFETFPGQTVKTGDYIKWAKRTWLVYEADADDEVYIDGKMYECNYKLYWQDSTGKIISKWAYIQNASSYSNGESGNATLTLSSNQFLVIMPLDDDTVNLSGTRMIIDNVTSGNPSPYELTRPDNVSMKFGDKGCTYYIFTLKEFSIENDKKVTLENGTQVWICNYITPTTPPTPSNPDENPDKTTVHCKINWNGKKMINAGGTSKTLTTTFTDDEGNVLTGIEFTWSASIIEEFSEYLHTEAKDNNTFKIWIDFDNLLPGNYIKVFVNDSSGNEITSETFEIGGVL